MEQKEATRVASKPAQRDASRNAVIAVVILLIVVAIAGIVLAGRRTAAPLQGTAAALPNTPAQPGPQATTPQGDVAPTPRPNDVVFEAGSSRLPAEANDLIARFSDKARGAGGMVRMSARYATGATKASDVELSKSRTAAVQHALQANGVKAESMQVELIEMPPGTLAEREVNRVELSLR